MRPTTNNQPGLIARKVARCAGGVLAMLWGLLHLLDSLVIIGHYSRYWEPQGIDHRLLIYLVICAVVLVLGIVTCTRTTRSGSLALFALGIALAAVAIAQAIQELPDGSVRTSWNWMVLNGAPLLAGILVTWASWPRPSTATPD